MELSWMYSRNQRRHTAVAPNGDEIFWITSLAPYGAVQGKHGYALRKPHAEQNLAVAASVADLKRQARELAAK